MKEWLRVYPILSPAARLVVGVISLAVLVSALVLAAVSLLGTVRPTWLLFGFECVVLVAGVLGLIAARGRFREGPGLALACVGGTILVASFLGWLAVRGELPLKGTSVSLKGWLAGRVAAGLMLGMLGGLTVLARNPESWKYILRALVAGLPLGAMGIAAVALRGRLVDLISGLPGILGVVVWALLAVLAGISLCAAVHCTIRAFELGRGEAKPAA